MAATRGGKWTPMLFIGLGVAMIIVDATIVNVAVPTIIRDLGITSTDAEWINAIYALVFAALLITFGRTGDVLGRKRVFLVGTIVFGVASVLAARSATGPELIAARALQGVGGAMILPTSLSLVNATYTGRDRAVAFGFYGSIIGGMAAVGPLIGGWLTTYHSWRWAFYINVPIAIVLVVGLVFVVQESRDEHAERGFDVWGTVLSATGLGLLVFGLIEGQRYGWVRPSQTFQAFGGSWPYERVSPVFVAFVGAAAALLLFVAVERRRRTAGRLVLLDLTLFSIRSFRFGNIAALIVSLGEFGLLFSIPLFLQSVLGYSALGTGWILVSLALGAFVAGPTAAQLANRWGARTVSQIGLVLEIVGITSFGILLSTTITAWAIMGTLFVYGLGVGYASAQLTNVILADVPVAQSGIASGTQSTSRQVGSALGTAILGTILFTSLAHQTQAELEKVPGLTATQVTAISDVVKASGGTAIPALAEGPGGQASVDAASQAFVVASRRTAFAAAGFLLIGLAATSALPGRRPNEGDDVAPDRPVAEGSAT